MTQPTGVFVRLPLCEEQKRKVVAEMMFAPTSVADAFGKAILAVGTPVTGGKLEAVCSIDEDILRNIRDLGEDDEEYVTDMVFRPGYNGTVQLCRLSDAQAAIAALEAEVGRLRVENEKLHRIAYSGRGTLTHTIHSPARFADEARKGPEA